ncbi:hypothetical protein Bhyg_06073 [Pseudolycoriella hygida]|uniref:Uncharacterized protein n=1 Tax=Pseudolycoriella hygida TaxID=35572 RepID=A0A9Q0N045_9DIPT|nr:hypothetical protein Bhyg_06073 [Pseudolycoriella hygida]
MNESSGGSVDLTTDYGHQDVDPDTKEV